MAKSDTKSGVALTPKSTVKPESGSIGGKQTYKRDGVPPSSGNTGASSKPSTPKTY